VTVNTPYDPNVGRPPKRPEDRYTTPPRSYRPPAELYERAKAKVDGINADVPAGAKRFTISDVLIHALEEFVRDDWKDWR